MQDRALLRIMDEHNFCLGVPLIGYTSYLLNHFVLIGDAVTLFSNDLKIELRWVKQLSSVCIG